MNVMPGPDFPTGGIICGSNGVLDYYKTGKGKIVVRAKIKIEEKKNKRAIIVTEIPYQVNKAQLLEEIVELIKEKKPDLIFTGIDMPEMDGFTMIRELKKDPELAKIPIMISSHLNREKDQLTAKGLGVQEFIYYGFVTVNEVVKKARNLLGERK